MSYFEKIEIHSSEDININTALGKKVILNGVEFAGNGVGLRFQDVNDKIQSAITWYSRGNVEIRTNVGKKVTINGTQYVSTTGIARVQTTYTQFLQDGLDWYLTGDLIINTPSGSKILINDVEITGTPEVPSTASITSLSPNNAYTSSGQLVTINGTGFTPTTIVTVDGVGTVQGTYVSATQITTTYLGTVDTAGKKYVHVKKPGELESNAGIFDVNVIPAPTLISLSPSTLQVSSGTLVTLTGTNFFSGCVVKIDGVGVQTTFVSATSLTTTYLGTVASASTVAVTVQNPDTQTSNPVNFILTAAPVGPIPTSGLMGWWDASDLTTFSTSDGFFVTQWRDKSSNNLHLASVSNVKINTRTENGLNVVDLNTAGNLYSANITKPQPITTFFVVHVDSIVGGNSQILSNQNTTPTVFLYGDKWAYYQSTVISSTTVVDFINPHVITNLFNEFSSEMWLDGVSIVAGSVNVQGYIDKPINLGNVTYMYDGAIGEAIIYDRVLTTPERQQVESYLKTKWGTP